MSDWAGWLIGAGILVIAELFTGTFYLLMVAIGLAAGAVCAHAGAPLPAQFAVAAVVGGAAVMALRLQRGRHAPPAPAQANPDVNPDIGEIVNVETWQADGTALVRHRGATWTAVAAPGGAPAPGKHRVRDVLGNRLVLEKT